MYKLNNKEDRKLFNDVSGVYALVYDNQAIYVGQSIKVGKRLSTHSHPEARIRDIRKHIISHNKKLDMYLFIQSHMDDIYFVVIECPIEELNKLEEEKIMKHQPRYNTLGVDIRYAGEKRYGMVN